MRRLAVIGWPVGHSRSPAMHTAALEALGLADRYSYEALAIEPGELGPRIEAMPADGFVGANITIPHKQASLALADEASERAAAIGAANTLSFVDGRILAENTDAPGLVAAIDEPLTGRAALVIGAGGAARAAAWGLRDAGAQVMVWNRTEDRARALAASIGAGVSSSDASAPPVVDFELVVNSTSVGLGSGEGQLAELGIDPGSLGPEQIVVDLPYRGDGGETELIRVARARGSRVVDGIEVLVCQGAESLRIWTGAEPPVAVMREAARTSC